MNWEGLADFDSLADDQKARFAFAVFRYVGNVQNGMLLHEEGMLDRETLEDVVGALAMSLACPGGQAWWQSFDLVPQNVRAYVDGYLARTPVEPGARAMPYWVKTSG